MNEAGDYPRTYYLSYWAIALLILFGIAVLGVGAAFLFLASSASLEPGASTLWLLIGAAVAAAGTWLIAAAIRTRVVLAADMVGVHGAMRTRQLERADIAGKRVLNLQYGQKVTVLCSKESRARDLKVPSYLRTDATWDAWFGALPDLDAQAARDFEAEVATNAELGQTPEERLGRLAKARKLAQALNIASGAVAAWGYVYPQPYQLALLALAVLPWIAIVLVARSPVLYRIDPRRGDPGISLALPLVAPGFVLLVRGLRDVGVLDVPRAMILAAIVALLLAWAALMSDATLRARPWKALLWLAFGGAYGYGAVVLANSQLDRSPGEQYRVAVLARHVSRSSRSTTYHLMLDRWGPRLHPADVSVARDVYEQAAPGALVCVHSGPGALTVPWYVVRLCE